MVAGAGPRRVVLTLPRQADDAGVVKRWEDPPLGWISYRMVKKLPLPVPVWRETITGTVQRTTVIDIASA